LVCKLDSGKISDLGTCIKSCSGFGQKCGKFAGLQCCSAEGLKCTQTGSQIYLCLKSITLWSYTIKNSVTLVT